MNAINDIFFISEKDMAAAVAVMPGGGLRPSTSQVEFTARPALRAPPTASSGKKQPLAPISMSVDGQRNTSAARSLKSGQCYEFILQTTYSETIRIYFLYF